MDEVESVASLTSSDDDSETYGEPWDVVTYKLHLASYAEEILAPLSMGSAIGDEEHDEKKLDEEEGDDEAPGFAKWDKTYLTVAMNAISLGGLKTLHEFSASSSYRLIVDSDEETRRGTNYWLWLRVSIPESNHGVNLMQLQVNNEWHGSHFRVKSSLAEHGVFHWQKYPRPLVGAKDFTEEGTSLLRVMHASMGIKLSALWTCDDENRYPPGYDKGHGFPVHILHCTPSYQIRTYDSSRPWTACRVPDAVSAKRELEQYQNYILESLCDDNGRLIHRRGPIEKPEQVFKITDDKRVVLKSSGKDYDDYLLSDSSSSSSSEEEEEDEGEGNDEERNHDEETRVKFKQKQVELLQLTDAELVGHVDHRFEIERRLEDQIYQRDQEENDMEDEDKSIFGLLANTKKQSERNAQKVVQEYHSVRSANSALCYEVLEGKLLEAGGGNEGDDESESSSDEDE